MGDHTYNASQRHSSSATKKRKRDEAKRNRDQRRGKTRVNIGVAFPRWKSLMWDLRLKTDAEVACFLLDSYEKGSLISLTSTGTCMQEPTAQSHFGNISTSERCKHCQQDGVEHWNEAAQKTSEEDLLPESYEEMEVTIDEDECNSVKNRLSDLDSDMENVQETPELSSPGADDSCDEDVYVPLIPQSRSTTSQLVLECEEEELEPWQKQTSHVQPKVEDDVGELSHDQTDCKPDPSLKTNTGFIVVSAQLASNTELIGSPGTLGCSGNSPTVIPAAQHELFQKETTAAIKTEADDIFHTSEEHQISNNLVSLSSVYAASSTQLQSDQSNSQTLPVPISLRCFTVLKLESTGTSNKQQCSVPREHTNNYNG